MRERDIFLEFLDLSHIHIIIFNSYPSKCTLSIFVWAIKLFKNLSFNLKRDICSFNVGYMLDLHFNLHLDFTHQKKLIISLLLDINLFYRDKNSL